MKIEQTEYFMKIAEIVKDRSSCLRRKVGAVLVRNNMIISSGYNETCKGYINCEDGGCMRCKFEKTQGNNLDMCFCNHAESNCIVQAAYAGVSTKESILYTTFSPCLYCAKEIINAGIIEVYYKEDYPGIEKVKEVFDYCKIKFTKLN